LPEAIGRLADLLELHLEGNQLTELPEAIGQLANLRDLHLSNNQLTELPEAIRRLVNLQQLYLHGNDALGIPPDILGLTLADAAAMRASPAPPAQILDYYFRSRTASRSLNEAKLILLGRGEVGKTSLVNRLVRNQFNLGEPTTHGINITPWKQERDDETITLHVWDFGGQEIMHATHQFFLTERTLYLLVLNGRQGQEDSEAEYWLELVRSFGGDSPVIVVMNKIRQHPFDLNRAHLPARFPSIKDFIHTDCAENVGLDDLRRLVSREVGALPHVRAKFPARWFDIKERLAAMSENNENYITYEKFQEICAELGETDPQAQDTLAGLLHALGIALNYRDDPRLSDKHILNPLWVTAGIYAAINSPLLQSRQGVLHPSDLSSILDGKHYPRSMHRFLLDLMRKFDICFALPDDSGRYLLPELLGKQEPAEVSRFDPALCLNFEYRYTILPEGLLPRLIARTHWYSEGRPRWRTGVLLGFDDNTALVSADIPRERVSIRVTGPEERRRQLLAIIRAELDRIHADFKFKANPPEPYVPLPGHPEVAIPYSDLIAFEKENVRTMPVRVGGALKHLDVFELLNGVELPNARRGRQRVPGVRVFLSYSHKDETHKAMLCGHILPLVQEGVLDWWDDRHLRPGDDWAGEIDGNLNRADLILLLVSRHFLASHYCSNIEAPRAMERQRAGEALVLPIVLDDADVWSQPYMSRQTVLADARPILSAAHWPNPNDAWRMVAVNLREVASRRRQPR
jgi:internalin A